MTYLRSTSRRASGFVSEYWNSTYVDLWDCYEKPSQSKVEAYRACLKFEGMMRGKRGRILSYNTFQFSYGFLVQDDDGEQWLIVRTKDHDYKIPTLFKRGQTGYYDAREELF